MVYSWNKDINIKEIMLLNLLTFLNSLNQSSISLIFSSKYSIYATWFLILASIFLLVFFLIKAFKFYFLKKINFFNLLILVAVYGSFTKFIGYSVLDELIIYTILIFFLFFRREEFNFEINKNNLLLLILLIYLVIHFLFFLSFDKSLFYNLRYIRFFLVISFSIFILSFVKEKKINFNTTLNFCFYFVLFLIIYSFFGDIFYRNSNYLRLEGELNPINLFYDVGGPGKFIIQNLVVSGSRNYFLLVILTIYLINKSDVSFGKKIVIYSSLLFLSLYSNSNISLFAIYFGSIILVISNYRNLSLILLGNLFTYVFIFLLFSAIHLTIPKYYSPFFFDNTNKTILNILSKISLIPTDILYKKVNSKYLFDSSLTEYNLSNEILEILNQNKITKIQLIASCNKKNKEKTINELLSGLNIDQKLPNIICDRITSQENILKKRKKIGAKGYINPVDDRIIVFNSGHYVFNNFTLNFHNHAVTEAFAHLIATLDKERSFFQIIFGSGINSHRYLLQKYLKNLNLEINDEDLDEEIVKKNNINSNFSSYSLQIFLFELGYLIIIFFILFLILNKNPLENHLFLFLIICSITLINFNDAIMFYIYLFYLILNNKEINNEK